VNAASPEIVSTLVPNATWVSAIVPPIAPPEFNTLLIAVFTVLVSSLIVSEYVVLNINLVLPGLIGIIDRRPIALTYKVVPSKCL
jgi:hypothetical protein